MKDITPKQLKARLDAGEDITIVDVREDWEVALGKVAQAIHIPMDLIPEKLDDLPVDKPLVIMCHTGRRSEQVALWLESDADYDGVLNLVGGIEAWSNDVDPSIQGKY